MSIKIENIRNFCIIAHIDHGKSTLADRLIEMTNTFSISNMENQLLDDMDLEKERGITIKSHPIQMIYKHTDNNTYKLNLIDTPGHVDFSYEVSRSMAACEGALLLIDCTQGVEAQTVSNTYMAIDSDLEIIPILNKVDRDIADIEGSITQVQELLGCNKEEIVQLSAKTGEGVRDLFDIIINKIPSPKKFNTDQFKALIFDSYYDKYRGVVIYIRVMSGIVSKGMTAKFFNYEKTHEVIEIGILEMERIPKSTINEGDVGYMILNVKEVSKIKVGDTVTVKEHEATDPLPGYKPIKSMVFSGLYPIESKDFEHLRVSLDRLKLNDASLSFEPNTSLALGFGFRCGFLGPLHMEIVQERLEREFDINLITTCPNVKYNLLLKNGESIQVDNPSDMPDSVEIDKIYEPYIKAEIILPKQYIGPIIKLCTSYRGLYTTTTFLSTEKAQLIFEMPLGEIIFDFFERLKSASRGYASLDYDLIDKRESKLLKLDMKVGGELVDALSLIIHESDSYRLGSKLCRRLKKEIHRQQFEIAIQAVIGQKVIARETVKALRKNVTAKCYGGDISRKRKLLEKQKAGKKRMKQIGSVELPQEAFLAILKSDDE